MDKDIVVRCGALSVEDLRETIEALWPLVELAGKRCATVVLEHAIRFEQQVQRIDLTELFSLTR